MAGRCLFLVLDGLGDWGFPQLGGETPLQAARTPNLDALVSAGMTGLYHALSQGVPLPSEMAHFLMFGYDRETFPGRGYLEALGYDIPLEKDDIALLSRIFGVEERQGQFILVDEKPTIIDDEAHVLQVDVANFSSEGLDVRFRPTRGVEGIVVIGGGASPYVTDTNPIHEGRPIMKARPLAEASGDDRAELTCRVLNEYLRWSYGRLSHNPINRRRELEGKPSLNIVGTQRAGRFRPAAPFAEVWGLSARAFVAGHIFFGLCRHIGMEVSQVKDTGAPGKDLQERLEMAWADETSDFLFVHTKAPDDAAHTKDPQMKKEVIEALDKGLSPLKKVLEPDGETLLVVVADHSTPSGGKMIHGGGTVPILMVGPRTRRDVVSRFDEVSCAWGGLGPMRGGEVMRVILDQMDRGQLLGLRDAPGSYPYFPGPFEPLSR